ncbi:MAG: hypothetical protein J2O49_11195, partial [Sciscionella sp.]|nr:hypothetical protein [Sciscionella sp.]
VGGSSRIPLVATLIAGQLGVVPVNLDQPETAVALGAHHVPQDGISMRTQDLGGQLAGAQSAPPAPVTGGFPSQAGPPTGAFVGANPSTSGPHSTPTAMPPIGSQSPPSGPTPVQSTSGQPTSGPQSSSFPSTSGQAPLPSSFPTSLAGSSFGDQSAAPESAKPKSNKKPLFIGAGVLVVALLVVGGIFLFKGGGNDNSGQTTADCGSSGSKDSNGLTKCMQQLAGNVPKNTSCSAGTGSATSPFADFNVSGTKATCTFSGGDNGHLVLYIQSDSPVDPAQLVSKFMSDTDNTPTGNAVEGDWQGSGLQGRYVALGSDSDVTALAFAVKGQPIAGLYVGNYTHDDPNHIADLFAQKVQPGS